MQLTAPRAADDTWRVSGVDRSQPDKRFDLLLDACSGQKLYYAGWDKQTAFAKAPPSAFRFIARIRLVESDVAAGVRRWNIFLHHFRMGDVFQAPPAGFIRPAALTAAGVEIRFSGNVNDRGRMISGHALTDALVRSDRRTGTHALSVPACLKENGGVCRKTSRQNGKPLSGQVMQWMLFQSGYEAQCVATQPRG